MLSPRAFTLNKDASEELAPKDVDADANGSRGGNAQKEIIKKYSFLKQRNKAYQEMLYPTG